MQVSMETPPSGEASNNISYETIGSDTAGCASFGSRLWVTISQCLHSCTQDVLDKRIANNSKLKSEIPDILDFSSIPGASKVSSTKINAIYASHLDRLNSK